MSQSVPGNFYRIPGQSISWVGECPWTRTIAFGSEEGWLSTILADAGPDQGEFFALNLATAPINGVAFEDEWMAISTPAEVALYMRGVDLVPAARHAHSFNGGAFGVVGTGSGGFLAPIGTDGLLLLDPKLDRSEDRLPRIIRFDDRRINYHKIADVAREISGRTFACASRRDGLVGLHLTGGRIDRPLINHRSHREDIVDVCGLMDPNHPRGVVCIGRNRGIHVFRDVLADRPPRSIRFESFEGNAYSIASLQGHLFVLTDAALYVLPDIAARLLREEPIDRIVKTCTVVTDASEAFAIGLDRLLLLEDNGVLEYSAAGLIAGLGDGNARGDANRFRSAGREHASVIRPSFQETQSTRLDVVWSQEFHMNEIAC